MKIEHFSDFKSVDIFDNFMAIFSRKAYDLYQKKSIFWTIDLSIFIVSSYHLAHIYDYNSKQAVVLLVYESFLTSDASIPRGTWRCQSIMTSWLGFQPNEVATAADVAFFVDQ